MSNHNSTYNSEYRGPSFLLHPEWFGIPEYRKLNPEERFEYQRAVIEYGLYHDLHGVPDSCREYFEKEVIPTINREKWDKNTAYLY